MIFQKGLFDSKVAGRPLPYNMLSIVGIVILLFNIVLSKLWPFKDPLTILIFTCAIILLLLGIVIFRYYSTFIAIMLLVIVCNGVIFWVTFHLGRASGAMLYYFPFLVGFLYLFFYNSNMGKTVAQVAVTVVFITNKPFEIHYR